MSRFSVFMTALIPFTLGMWGSTQRFAELVHYDTRFLGTGILEFNVFTEDHYALYAPWKFFSWYMLYSEYVSELFLSSALFLVIGTILAFGILYFLSPKRKPDSHGSARWAENSDLKKMDLVSTNGVVVGLWDSHWKQALTSYLRYVENIKNAKVAEAEKSFNKSHMDDVDDKVKESTDLTSYIARIDFELEDLEKQKSTGLDVHVKEQQLIADKEESQARLDYIRHFIDNPPKYNPSGITKLWVSYYNFLNHLYRHIPHNYLRDNSNKHLAVVAPTRSGKGVGLIVPTLLGGWNESCIVNDIKSENWGITAGYRRKMGQKVIKFEPTADDGSSARWNPLDEVPICTSAEVSMAQNLASVIADSEGKGKADHWIANASNVIMACILHLKYAHYADPEKYPNEPSLFTVASFLKANLNEEKPTATADEPKEEENTDPNKQTPPKPTKEKKDVLGFVETIKGMLDFQHVPKDGLHFKQWDSKTHAFRQIDFMPEDLHKLYPSAPTLMREKYKYTHPIILQAFMEISSKPADELGSIISTANTALKEYLDPVLAKNTSVSDFCVDDLMNYKRPVTLYLVTPPSDLLRLSPIFRLFFEMMVRCHSKSIGEYVNGQARTIYRHKCLFLMDEFSSLGNLTSFASTLSFIAGYGMKVFLINQGIPQINAIYGKDNHILMNCHLEIFYAPNEPDSGSYVEKRLGNKTIITESKSENSTGGFFTRNSISKSETGRPLMTADEVSRMGEKEIIFATGFPSVFTDKIKYYENNFFLNKLCDAPTVSDTTREVTPENYPERFALLRKKQEELRDKFWDTSKKKSSEIVDLSLIDTTHFDAEHLDFSFPELDDPYSVDAIASTFKPITMDKFSACMNKLDSAKQEFPVGDLAFDKFKDAISSKRVDCKKLNVSSSNFEAVFDSIDLLHGLDTKKLETLDFSIPNPRNPNANNGNKAKNKGKQKNKNDKKKTSKKAV